MKKAVKILYIALVVIAVALGIVLLAQAQSITIGKDIDFGEKQILNIGGIRFSDNSTMTSASGVGGSSGWTASSTKLYPSTADYVGVGTTNPTSPLHVVGTTTIAGVLQVGGSGSPTEASAAANIYRAKYFDTDNLAYYVDPANATISGLFAGSVGIGNTNPGSYKLNVTGTINSTGLYVDGVQYVSSQWTTASGNVYFTTGNVGIGTSTPAYKLHVSGKIYADDGTSAADIIANKIDAVTVDPVYTIGGIKYATYLPGMTGVKEETTGVVRLSYLPNQSDLSNRTYSYTFDFVNVREGSDLWLFAKTTNLEKEGLGNVAVLLTPNFDGRVWYEKDANNKKISIYGSPTSIGSRTSQNWEVSYRLTAPRLDYRAWTNYSGGDWEGLNIDAFLKNNP